MKSRTSISLTQRPEKKPNHGSLAFAAFAGSRTCVAIFSSLGPSASGQWLGGDGGPGPFRLGLARRRPGLAKEQSEENGEADAVDERLERDLIVDELALAAAADLHQQGAENRSEQRRQREVDEVDD